MEKIQIEISPEYRETLDFLKQVLAWKTGAPIQNDTELVEMMIGGFMMMIEQEMGQAGHIHDEHCNHTH